MNAQIPNIEPAFTLERMAELEDRITTLLIELADARPKKAQPVSIENLQRKAKDVAKVLEIMAAECKTVNEYVFCETSIYLMDLTSSMRAFGQPQKETYRVLSGIIAKYLAGMD